MGDDTDSTSPVRPSAKPDQVVAVRTLVAAGYSITGAHRQPTHIEIESERLTALGGTVNYLIAVTDNATFPVEAVPAVLQAADRERRAAVFVSEHGCDRSFSWDEFLSLLGGAVPTWIALSDGYSGQCLAASRDEVPPGLGGEAWRIFEELAADGLEFVFGRRVRRLGGRRRGSPVSDLQAQLPDRGLVVVDAKASRSGFAAEWGQLRPLGEYIERQRIRQRGAPYDVVGSLVVSSAFSREDTSLMRLSAQFNAAFGCPVAFLEAAVMCGIVDRLKENVIYRGAINWRGVLAGGRVALSDFEKELQAVHAERIGEKGDI